MLSLRQFWQFFKDKQSWKIFYISSNRAIQLRLLELQENNVEIKKIQSKDLPEGWKDIDSVLQYYGFQYVPEIIRTKLISYYHNNQLVGFFSIDKTRKLEAKKYYWSTFYRDVEAYVQGYDVCLILKAVKHKPHNNIQFLLVLTHCWRDLLIDFVIGLLLWMDWKRDNYDTIIVIVDRLTKMV